MITAKYYNDGFDQRSVKTKDTKIKLTKCLTNLYYTFTVPIQIL